MWNRRSKRVQHSYEMTLPPKLYQFLVGFFASLGPILYGYDLGVIAGVIAAPSFIAYFNTPTDAERGAIIPVFTGGAFFGAGFAGPVGDWLGRKLTILTGAAIFCLGAGLQTGAVDISFLYAGRAIAGLGVGFLVMIVLVSSRDFEPEYQRSYHFSPARDRRSSCM